MYYLILLVFFLSLVAFFYFKFIFVPFFLIYLLFGIFLFFCASQESIMCFICKLLFSVLSLLAFGKSSEKGTVKTIQTIGKTQIPFDFAVGLWWSWATQFALFLPTLPSKFLQAIIQPQNQPRSRALSYSSTKRTLRTTLPEASRRSAIHIFLVKVSIRFTCWRRSLNWLHHQHHCCPLPLTSSLL